MAQKIQHITFSREKHSTDKSEGRHMKRINNANMKIRVQIYPSFSNICTINIANKAKLLYFSEK